MISDLQGISALIPASYETLHRIWCQLHLPSEGYYGEGETLYWRSPNGQDMTVGVTVVTIFQDRYLSWEILSDYQNPAMCREILKERYALPEMELKDIPALIVHTPTEVVAIDQPIAVEGLIETGEEELQLRIKLPRRCQEFRVGAAVVRFYKVEGAFYGFYYLPQEGSWQQANAEVTQAVPHKMLFQCGSYCGIGLKE